MTKPFKLRLHLPSFQFCRSKESSTLAKSPEQATHSFTPVNARAFDITYPRSPAPPPSSPNHHLCKRNIASKILPIGLEVIDPQLCASYASSSSNRESSAYEQYSTLEKLYNSPECSNEFDQSVWPCASVRAEKNNKEENQWVKDQSATSFTLSISSADSGWFTSEDGDDPDDESEGLHSSCSRLECSCDFGHPVKIPSDQKPSYGNVTHIWRQNLTKIKGNLHEHTQFRFPGHLREMTKLFLPIHIA